MLEKAKHVIDKGQMLAFSQGGTRNSNIKDSYNDVIGASRGSGSRVGSRGTSNRSKRSHVRVASAN